VPLRPALPFARYSGSNDRARADPRPVCLYRLVCDRSRSKPETVTQLTSVAVPGERSAAAAEESPSVQDQTVDVQYRHGGHKKYNRHCNAQIRLGARSLGSVSRVRFSILTTYESVWPTLSSIRSKRRASNVTRSRDDSYDTE